MLSRRWRPLCHASPSVSLVQTEAHPFFLVARAKQERRADIARAERLGTNGRVFIGVNKQRFRNDFAIDDTDLLRCVCLGPIEYTLCAAELGGYDDSLDDDPESGYTHFDTPLDQAVGRGRQVLAATTTLHADAIGVAGGGLLAWVVAVGPTQTNCSMVCPAGDRCFAEVPVGALWEEEMLRWGDNNHGLTLRFYMVELEVVAGAEPASARLWRPGWAGRATASRCSVRGHHEEKGYESDESDIWEGLLILKQDGGNANSASLRASRLASVTLK
jgi:hypothetical protein